MNIKIDDDDDDVIIIHSFVKYEQQKGSVSTLNIYNCLFHFVLYNFFLLLLSSLVSPY